MTLRTIVTYRDTDAQTRLADRLHEHNRIVVADVETTGLNPYNGDQIIGLALYWPVHDESYYVLVRHPDNNVLDTYWREVLRELPRCADVLIGFNFKFDLTFLGLDGMADPAAIEDVMIAAHLLNENEELSNGFQKRGAYQLKRLARKYLGAAAVADEDELKRVAKERGLDPKAEMWLLPGELVAPYAMADVEITWRLREFYMPALESWEQVALYRQRNAFLLKALLRMERNGIKVDLDRIAQHQAEIDPRIAELQTELDEDVSQLGMRLTKDKKDMRWINPNSPQQVRTYLALRGWEVDNTDKHTLTALADAGIQAAKRLLEYRTLSKANSTYYMPYLQGVDPKGFIHTTLNAIGTTSGRLSSDHPNMQQLPRDKRYKVKEVFVPRPGYASFGSDYKQLELRLGVHYANEETMRRMFNDGTDMHQFTADSLGVSRQIGKGANFGLLYGMGAKRAMLQLGIPSEEEAKRIVYGWRELYPAFGSALLTWQQLAQQWRDKDGSPGGKYQFIRLFNGRIRHYQEFLKYPIRDEAGNIIPPPYRDAWNFYIQGTGAAIAEASILAVCEALPDNDIFKPVLAVHDALEYEIALPYVQEVVPVIEQIMTDWPEYDPAMGVDTEFSLTNWREMQHYSPEVFAAALKERVWA